MEQVCQLTGLSGVTFYWARHTFASVARNDCRMSKDDVALALNHVDEGHRSTDIYIEKDWGIVDYVQENVTNLLQNLDRPVKIEQDKPIPSLWQTSTLSHKVCMW